MNKHALIFLSQNRDIFEMVRDGSKKVETRASGPKYADIVAGDTLTFSCDRDEFEKVVSKVTHFPTMQDVFKVYRPEIIHPGIYTEAGLIDMWQSFPGYQERIAEFGLLAFELE